jgi:hypothetical protein
MKNVFRLLIPVSFAAMLSLGTSCTSNNDNGLDANVVNNDGKLPVMTFVDTTHDFGKIEEGEKVTYTFNFKNTGQGTLVIESATSSCGCTVPEKPEEPVPPGGSGHITVKFNSEGKSNVVHKEIYLTANTRPSRSTLYITADIQPRQQ